MSVLNSIFSYAYMDGLSDVFVESEGIVGVDLTEAAIKFSISEVDNN